MFYYYKKVPLDCEEILDYQIESELFDNKDYIINKLFQTCSLSSLFTCLLGEGGVKGHTSYASIWHKSWE